jgi:hypothetical protein
MSEILLQVNFNFSVSKEEYQEAVAPLVDKFSELPGLKWKVWILNAENKEAGGIYLFESQATLDEYLSGSLAKIVTTHPALSNFSIKQFAIMEGESKRTRGPISYNN